MTNLTFYTLKRNLFSSPSFFLGLYRHDFTVNFSINIIKIAKAYLPTHCLALKWYPSLQSHRCVPSKFLQNWFRLQSLSSEHGSKSFFNTRKKKTLAYCPDPFYVLRLTREFYFFYFYSTRNHTSSNQRASTPKVIYRLHAQAGERNLYKTPFSSVQRKRESITKYFISSLAVICDVYAGHPRRTASHKVLQKLHYKIVRSENLLDLIHVIVLFCFFMFLCFVWPVYIAVEVQFYIYFRFIIFCFRYVLHGNKLKVKNKS